MLRSLLRNMLRNKLRNKKMEQIEIIIKSLRHLMKNLIWNGVFAIICGIAIVVYPELLRILVSLVLVAFGIVNLIAAAKVGRYSKIRFKI